MNAKLIYKSNMTFLPTNLPVQYFGLPDGKVYIIFARFYTTKFNRSEIEYVFAIHKEFAYDYDKEKLRDLSDEKRSVYSEMVDKSNSKIEIIKVYRTLRSFAEASALLDKRSQHIYEKNDVAINKKIQLLPNDHAQSATA